MEDFSVALKIVSERNCPYYTTDDMFVLTGQAVQMPIGHPSCLILVREVSNLLFNTIIPAVGTGFGELTSEIYNCGGCTGLIKFQIDDNPEALLLGGGVLPVEDASKSEDGSSGKQRVKQDGVVVSGQLSNISPAELFQFFHMYQKTGKLVLDVGKGTGRVAFREGSIIGAKFMEFEDKEAFFALLCEHEGMFHFVNGIPQALLEVDEIGDFMMLLMEGVKRMDEGEG
jgi:hypothetical protein